MKCCEEYAIALSAFADGELNEAERNDLLSHLEHCEGCREHLSELMLLHAMFEDLPEPDAPDGFAESVLARVHEEERGKKRRHRALFRTLAACFALVLVTAAAMRFVLPGAGKMSADNTDDCADENAAVFNGTAGDVSYGDDFSTTRSDSIHYELSGGNDPDAYADSEGTGDREKRAEADNVSYRNVRVDSSDAAEFLSMRGMAVYEETEESVSFLVTPEVSHELAAEESLGAEVSALLADTDELVIVEVRIEAGENSEAEDSSADESGTSDENGGNE